MVDRRLIAIDPGGTTGIAVRVGDMQPVTCVTKTPDELWDFLSAGKFTHCVIEDFQANRVDRHMIYTIRLVGGVEASCRLLGIELKKHTPQDRYPFRKEAEEFLRGSKAVIHERDALMHLFRWEHDND